MKKTKLIYVAAALVFAAAVFTGCKDKSGTAETVTTDDLEDSGATTNVTADNADATMEVIGNDDALSTCLDAIMKEIKSSFTSGSSGYLFSRDVTASDFKKEFQDLANELYDATNKSGEAYNFYKNLGTEHDASWKASKEWGEITTDISGLTLKIPAFKASFNVKESSDKIISGKAALSFNSSAALVPATFIASYNAANPSDTISASCVKALKVAVGLDSNLKVSKCDYAAALSSKDLPTTDQIAASGDITYTGNVGMSFKTDSGVGGKLIICAEVSIDTSYEDIYALKDDIKNLIKDSDSLTVDQKKENWNKLPITVSFTATFYDDNGKNAYQYCKCSTPGELYEFIKTKNLGNS